MGYTLYNLPSFRTRPEFLSNDERILLTYERSQEALRALNWDLSDIQTLSEKYWDMHRDPAMALDVGCINILSCHLNLFLGTLIDLAPGRPDLNPLIERALKGEILGNFLLSELGHGLDIMSQETTATMVKDGFILNTPKNAAAKFMPPTTPHPKYSKAVIVFARLIINNRERGIHPFLVHTSTPQGMCPGVISKLLPPRSGTSPLDYALTYFDHVHIPAEGFLGHIPGEDEDTQALLQKYIWRTIVGQVSISMIAITGLKLSACVGVEYSFRRHVRGKLNHPTMPIMSFRTQQIPMLQVTALSYVLDAWASVILKQFTDQSLPEVIRRGLAVVFKTTVCRLATGMYKVLGERMGAQGTFGHNFVSQIEMDMRGLIIAEGDITVTSIRLLSQLVQGSYTLPEPTHSSSVLAQHSAAVFSQLQHLLALYPGPHGHRNPAFSAKFLPQCERGVLAMGCAYAYGCALETGVPQSLIDIFECLAIKLDSGWYEAHTQIRAEGFLEKEESAADYALPKIREYINGLNVKNAVSDRVPIWSDDTWKDWESGLRTYSSLNGNRQDAAHATGGSLAIMSTPRFDIQVKGRL